MLFGAAIRKKGEINLKNMAKEIEFKYLVKNDGYKEMADSCVKITQGYLSRVPERTVRVRIYGKKGFITIKGKNRGAIRDEFEYEIPLEDAREIMKMCETPILEKIRYIVKYRGRCWEVDEFLGELSPLVTAEIELRDADEKYDVPDFIGEDITGDPAYYNSNLFKLIAGKKP